MLCATAFSAAWGAQGHPLTAGPPDQKVNKQKRKQKKGSSTHTSTEGFSNGYSNGSEPYSVGLANTESGKMEGQKAECLVAARQENLKTSCVEGCQVKQCSATHSQTKSMT